MRYIKISDRYLAREFMKPFIVALLGITVIILSGYLLQMTDYIIIRNIPIPTVLKLLLYKLPEIIVQSLALATLFATLLTLSQMVKNNEFVALRMGGISFLRLILPFLILALIISASAFFLNDRLVPQANRNYRQIVRYEIRQQQEKGIHENVFFRDYLNRYIYIGQVNEAEEKLSNIMIHNDGKENLLITANTGNFEKNRLILNNGLEYQLDQDEYVASKAEFEQFETDIGDSLDNFYQRQRRPSEMKRSELQERIELFRRGGFKIRSLLVQYHINLAEALIPLIFVIIGAPLSIKSDKGRVFGIIVSVILLFSYYLWFSVSRALGLSGHLEPIVAAWSANVVFFVVGLILSLREDGIIS